jgi:FtsH-binding integral membrane protein
MSRVSRSSKGARSLGKIAFSSSNKVELMPTLQHYIDASIAVSIMLTFGAVAGFMAFGVTDDRSAIAITMGVVFLLTGAVLLLRVWLLSLSSAPPKESGTR